MSRNRRAGRRQLDAVSLPGFIVPEMDEPRLTVTAIPDDLVVI
jgi:hypothetical protein